MALTRIVIEGLGSGWTIEIDGPHAPRDRVKVQSDSDMVDFIEEHASRLQRMKSAPMHVEPQVPQPPNLCTPVTRRSRKWAEQKQEKSDGPA